MTIPTEVAAVLADIRKDTSIMPGKYWADRLEAALTKAEAVEPLAVVCMTDEPYSHGHMVEAQLQIMPGTELPIGMKLYAHAPPAVPVESLCSDCPPVGYPTEATRCTPCPRRCEPVASVPDGWMPISSAPKGRKVIAGYHNRLGNWRTIIACYYPAGTLEKEDNFGDIDDDGYASEGWYEEAESQEVIRQTEEMPTHWQPLPTPPTNQEGAAPSTLAGFGPMPSVDLSGLTILDGEEEENHHGQ